MPSPKSVEEGRYVCPVCGQRFKTLGLKKSHTRKYHRKESSGDR